MSCPLLSRIASTAPVASTDLPLSADASSVREVEPGRRQVDPNVGNGKTINVSGISDSGADAGNYTLLNTTAITTADITGSAPTPPANRPDTRVDGAIAQAQSLLWPRAIATPYGVAPMDTVGSFSGNHKKQHEPIERNVERSDFQPGVALKVVDGGVRRPTDAPL
ncbi:MAG: hypothetical protein WDW36_003506 [Sanguina aurantia]